MLQERTFRLFKTVLWGRLYANIVFRLLGIWEA